MAEWLVKHRLREDDSLITTLRPEHLSFTLNTDAPHELSYEVSLSSPAVFHDFVGPKRTTFELWRDDLQIMGGIHTNHAVSTSDQFCHVTGKDWMVDLTWRHFPFDPRDGHWYDYAIGSPTTAGIAYQAAATDVAEIIKNLLDVTYGRPNSLDLTYPTLITNLGIPVNFSLSIGDATSMYEIINGLSENYPGFHFEVLTTKELRLYSPHKYDIAVADDSSLANHIYTDAASGLEDVDFENTGPQGTHIFGQGAGLSGNRVGIALGTPALNEAVYGRIDMVEDFGDIPSAALVESRTRGAFNFGLQPVHEISITVNPMAIGPSFWTLQRPGEAIWLDVDLISHRIQSAQEIVSMDVTVDEEGNESCTMKLNQIYADNNPGVYEG